MVCVNGDRSKPTREELLACLIPALKFLPVRETPSGPKIGIEALADIIIEHLADSGYAIHRKP